MRSIGARWHAFESHAKATLMSALTQRRTRATELLKAVTIDAVAFVPGPGFKYLTGVTMHLMERPTLFLITADGAMFAVMPALERQKWSASMPQAETFYWDDADGPADAFAALAAAVGVDGTLGIEGLRMRASEYLALSRLWPVENLVDADAMLSELRVLKDPEEIAELQRAISITETALAEVLHEGIAGRREVDIVMKLRSAMVWHGASGFSFPPIVLSGAASADPHGEPGDRQVTAGQPLLIDFGASYGDMHADITRTVFCDHASDAHADIYNTVRRANVAGRAAVRAGVAVGDVDDAATSVLEASPHASMILHKTGHGLGREVHEAPQVMRSNRALQRAGMVFTVEPGLYSAGDIGVRIEDDVLVTEDGVECLTAFSRELAVYA